MNKNPDCLPVLAAALLGALLGFCVACSLKDRAHLNATNPSSATMKK
jgi:hypothetical protein